ncbi:hypothetical protein VOLCADRAFT_87027 [Volvox carteri f. nagariensis]|uniref:MEKHLA domain-containing protein n=1 Tax=Volvox carteri f. nagariensis TaxID=3068 RepID=D8TJZ6_VOLCA|nr:uncharacterized protein VOLCADRAFT_87027 [Volvox carteri f. nagariensis]EFJ51975.1 hypothetical protein VOLCADRAFT_87027 [Volvox carteri f. nagariensis]|eukprot:XP_002946749.1 hypothetical protein VOLCADRAFT_87027 [Volvox carteri f. nagariensis]
MDLMHYEKYSRQLFLHSLASQITPKPGRMLLHNFPQRRGAAYHACAHGNYIDYQCTNIPHRLPGRCRAVNVQAAKKGGDKKGGDRKGQKKSALADLMKKKEAAASAGPTVQTAQYDTPEARMLAFQICDSYWRLTKKYLLEGVDFNRLPTEGVTDPIYTYGNRAALDLFEVTWDELLQTPSRKSAADDPDAQKDRNGLLDRAAETGVVSGFEVWRVSKSGRRFKIKDGTLFNIIDREGNKLGQAAVFHRYELEDGREVQITAPPPEAEAGTDGVGEEESPAIPSPAEIQGAEAAVSDQAAHVRSLKEQQGLTNQDIPVQLAVFELKKRKEHLAKLQKQLQDALAASYALFDDEDDE